MDENAEMLLKNICCACFSVNRRLTQLCRIENGVNNLFFLLSYNSRADDTVFHKGATYFFICWECKALIQKLCNFRNQTLVAEKLLCDIIDGKISDISKIESLSQLKNYYQNDCNKEYADNIDTYTFFIDCGPNLDIKIESDSDTPLSEFQNEHNFIELKENVTTDKKHMEDSKILNESKLKNKCRNRVIINNEIENGRLSNKTVDVQESVVQNEELTNFKKIVKKKKGNGYLCTECNIYFVNRSQKYKHMKTKHSAGHPCTVCGKTFPFKHHLTRHNKIHSDSFHREQCPICGKMVRLDLTKAHARIHTDRPNYECITCDKRFISRESYKNHLKYTARHTMCDVFKYKCSVCQKAYRSKGELRDHMNYQHMGRTVHKCPICDKAIATRRGITRHVKRAHQGIKENSKDKICQTCGKVFREKKCLYEHELIHTGERPLSCSICGRRFRQTASLYTHKRRIHNIIPKPKRIELTTLEDIGIGNTESLAI